MHIQLLKPTQVRAIVKQNPKGNSLAGVGAIFICNELTHFLGGDRYHSLHHSEMGTNFCLFMPLFDAIWKTLNADSWELHNRISANIAGN